MKRRNFIAFGGAAFLSACPFAAWAQQTKVHRIGALLLGIADADSFRTELRNELAKLGFVEGRNIAFDFRSAEEKIDRLPALAAELVAMKVDVIVALYTPCALAAQKATRDIPVVAIAGDLLRTGLVPTLSRPGGNITGVSMIAAELHGKGVELFRDLLPGIRRVGLLGNASDPFYKPILEEVTIAGQATGIEIAPIVTVKGAAEVDAAFATMKKEGAGAVVLQGSLASKQAAELAIKHRLPAATFARSFPEVGGLLAYGADNPTMFRQAAVFVGKILQGAKPGEMPAEQPTKFELVFNLKTAKALGITPAESFLLRADTILE